MHHNPYSRRDFLSGCAHVLGGGLLAFSPFRSGDLSQAQSRLFAVGRVSVPAINIYTSPSFDSERVEKREKDELLLLIERVKSHAGPKHNPFWYRLLNGYAHSGRIQVVILQPPNPLAQVIPSEGLLGEITVPISSAYRFSTAAGWEPLYRLYAQSIHRITAVDTGPDGHPWYRLFDDLMNAEYHAPASDLRPIFPQEYSPIAQEIPPEEKRVVVSIQEQTLTAYEGERAVLVANVSSGIHTEDVPEGELPTDTPTGSFRIQLKMPSRHMGDGRLTASPDAYELPGVPWAMVFHETGVALHGTYWHSNFGARMSHGCVNLRNADAKWLFRWTDPPYDPATWYVKGRGTLVVVV